MTPPHRNAPKAPILVGAALSLLLFLQAPPAHAFHSMIRHEYSACHVCHADPSGGGILTAYGRGLAETILRTRWGKQRDDGDPGTVGNFLFGAFTLPERLLLQADVRGVMQLPLVANASPQFMLMQADAGLQISFWRLRGQGSIGYIHEGALFASVTRGSGTANQDRLIARTYWLGVDLGSDNQFLLRAGRLNLPFGVRNIEHTMLVRMTTRTNIDDQQQVGVALSYNSSRIRSELMAIVGNFSIRPDDYRERGYSGYFEWTPKEKIALGASSLVTHAALDYQLQTPLWRHAHGLFARYSPHRMVALSLETDFLFYSQPPAGAAAANNFGGNVTALLADIEPIQGVHLLAAAEVQNTHFGSGTTEGSLWGGVWWFFLPHIDARLDFVWLDLARGSSGTQSNGYFLFQLHGFL
jgi:hypothetical protein